MRGVEQPARVGCCGEAGGLGEDVGEGEGEGGAVGEVERGFFVGVGYVCGRLEGGGEWLVMQGRTESGTFWVGKWMTILRWEADL